MNIVDDLKEDCSFCDGRGLKVSSIEIKTVKICPKCKGHRGLYWVDKILGSKQSTNNDLLKYCIQENILRLISEIKSQYGLMGISTRVTIEKIPLEPSQPFYITYGSNLESQEIKKYKIFEG